MKRNIYLLGFIFSLSLCGNINAQVTKTAFRGGYLNVIPYDFTISGESRVYTYGWGGVTDMSAPIVVYGRDFNTIEKQFSIPKPKPGNIKAECVSIGINEMTLKFMDEVEEKTYPSFLVVEQWIYNDSLDEYYSVNKNYTNIDTLLSAWNQYADANHLEHYESISSPEIFATILELVYTNNRPTRSTSSFIGFYDNDRNICCYNNGYGYPLSRFFYDYYNSGYKYPYDYYTIENNTVYHITKSYDWYVEIPAGYSFDWKPVEITSLRDREKNGEGFIWNLTYSNYDDLTFYNNEVNDGRSPFLTQTLFNNDEKYEYLTYKYEAGDWIKYEIGSNNDDIPYALTYGTSEYIYLDDTKYKIKDAKQFYNTNQISLMDYDSQNMYLFRNVYYRSVIETGAQVLTDDGVVIFSYDSSPDAIEGVYLDIFTYNGRNYMHIYEANYNKNEVNHTIYEIVPTTNSINVVERVSQPFASAQNGVINMILDNVHTDSNAELYNMSGQSMGSRYIRKGETRPTMDAAELPDGIYNLLLNRNGEIINSQKMLIK